MSTWFITGCSTGLGRALAQAALPGVRARRSGAIVNISSILDLAAGDPGARRVAVEDYGNFRG
jgi:NAD(P)-dependent dehydrogenase (short-subunit alcohol dehydrogenase family)